MSLKIVHSLTKKPLTDADGYGIGFPLFIPFQFIREDGKFAIHIGLVLNYITSDNKHAGYVPMLRIGNLHGQFEIVLGWELNTLYLWPIGGVKGQP